MSGEIHQAPAQTLLTDEERNRACEAQFSNASRRGSRIEVPTANGPLVFDTVQRTVSGACSIPFSQVKRCDLDCYVQEGDLKTHYFYYLVLGDGTHTFVFKERAKQYYEFPSDFQDVHRQLKLKLHAIPVLCGLEHRRTAEDMPASFDHVFSEAESAPLVPATETAQPAGGGCMLAAALVVLVCLSLLWWWLGLPGPRDIVSRARPDAGRWLLFVGLSCGLVWAHYIVARRVGALGSFSIDNRGRQQYWGAGCLHVFIVGGFLYLLLPSVFFEQFGWNGLTFAVLVAVLASACGIAIDAGFQKRR